MTSNVRVGGGGGGGAIARTGTAAQLDAGGGDGSTTATVPADCNVVVAFWQHYQDSPGTQDLATLTLNGVGFTIRAQDPSDQLTPVHGIGVATLVSPATGSQTVAWTWNNNAARTEGGNIVLVWVKDGNTVDPFRDADSTNNTDTNNVELTIDSADTDLVLAMATGAGATNPAI